MTGDERVEGPLENPEAHLEQALIEEYLRSRGLDPAALKALSESDLKQALTDASVYAANKLAEVEARAHYLHEIHGHE